MDIEDTDTIYKAKIKQRLAELLVSAWENEQLERANVAYLAGVIRDQLDAAKDSAEVFTFIEDLVADWPIFASIIGEPDSRPIKEV